MWMGLTALALLVSGGIVFREILRSQSVALSYLLFAFWVRYALSALPAITHPKVVAGFSINALGTLLIVALGFLIVPKRLFAMKLLGPFYIFIGLVLISGAINAETKGTIEASLRLCLLVLVQLSVIAALLQVGWKRVLGSLMTVFILPVTLQAMSIAVGNSTESVDSLGRSFIGGYGHESGFAMILLTLLLVAMFWQPRRPGPKVIVILWTIIGLGLANYRTGIISAVPIFLVIALAGFAASMNPRERTMGMALVMITLTAAAATLLLSSSAVIERFTAITEIFEIDFLKSPFEYTRADQDMLTGRVYIWSLYLDGFQNAGLVQKLIGFGPESWSGTFEKYAHNTFISYLYEYGIFGLISFICYWIANIMVCLRAGDRSLTVKFIAAYGGFTVLNLATMPLWQISGVMFFGLLNGFAAYALLTRTAPPPRSNADWRSVHPSKAT
jgi:O-antigen ligase